MDRTAGAVNTGVLLCSSLCMALAVHGERRRRLWLIATAALGALFLAIKGYEYGEKLHEHLVPGWDFQFTGQSAVQLFFVLYFVMTLVHAFHLTLGVAAVLLLAASPCEEPVELIGLYWHFVDVVWVFLFPLLYLVAPR